MDTFAYKGISDGKYVEGDIEAINSDETELEPKPSFGYLLSITI